MKALTLDIFCSLIYWYSKAIAFAHGVFSFEIIWGSKLGSFAPFSAFFRPTSNCDLSSLSVSVKRSGEGKVLNALFQASVLCSHNDNAFIGMSGHDAETYKERANAQQ
jgi:hypothetical protein